jgi:hypothetical protein
MEALFYVLAIMEEGIEGRGIKASREETRRMQLSVNILTAQVMTPL